LADLRSGDDRERYRILSRAVYCLQNGLREEWQKTISAPLNGSFHFNRIGNIVRTPDNHIELRFLTTMLDMPAGFLEYVGEQAFSALTSLKGRRILLFFRILHGFLFHSHPNFTALLITTATLIITAMLARV
jgi:hypothetical protein